MYKKYRDTQGQILENMIYNIETNSYIPFDHANMDYQAFLKYQAEGGKVYGADEEVPTPADEENT
jgi:hypothetical protein